MGFTKLYRHKFSKVFSLSLHKDKGAVSVFFSHCGCLIFGGALLVQLAIRSTAELISIHLHLLCTDPEGGEDDYRFLCFS